MPPKNKFTKEELVCIALKLVREEGSDALTARGLAERLGSSPKVIFGLFQNMEELKEAVLSSAERFYNDRIIRSMQTSQLPPYKASGLAYIRFAKEEKELFRLLFMRDRTEEPPRPEYSSLSAVIDVICKSTGMDRETALRFHGEMWMLVHGIAATLATSFFDWSDQDISDMLDDVFFGLKHRFLQKEN